MSTLRWLQRDGVDNKENALQHCPRFASRTRHGCLAVARLTKFTTHVAMMVTGSDYTVTDAKEISVWARPCRK